MTDFLDCVRPANPGEPIDEDMDRAINEALDAEERIHDTIPAAEICKLDTWCTRRIHPADEPCRVVPRRELERSDFGPNAAIRRRY